MIYLFDKDGRKTGVEKIEDRFGFGDKLGSPGNDKFGLKGRVIGYEIDKKGNKEKFLDKSNLIVYNGRLWAWHKLFNYNNGILASYQPFWFGAGKAGVTSDGSNQPLVPNDHDVDLYAPVIFDAANPAYADMGKKKPVPQPGTFFVTQDIIALIYSIYIDYNELNEGGSVSLNELALYLSPTDGVNETEFLMLSHLCFGSKTKDPSTAYQFEWWLYI